MTHQWSRALLMGTLSLHLSIWKRRSLVKIIVAEDLETVIVQVLIAH